MTFSRPRSKGSPISRRAFLKRLSLSAAALGLASAGGCFQRPTASQLGPLGLGRAGAGLLFHASFDRTLDADFAIGAPAARSAGARQWRIQGADGQALVAYPGGEATFRAVGNVRGDRGTLEFGIKLLQGFGDVPDAVYRFVSIQAANSAAALLVEAGPPETRWLRVRFHSSAEEYTEVASSVSRTWQTDEWHHFAVTWNHQDGNASLYMDGELVSTASLDSAAPAVLDGNLVIGSEDGGDAPAFAEIDDVRIFDRPRSEDAIRGDFVRFDVWSRGPDSMSWSPGVPSGVSLDLLPAPQLTLAIVSDAHFAENGLEEGVFTHDWRADALFEQLRQLKPAHVFHCGDMTAHSPQQPAAFASASQRCKRAHVRIEAPVHWVPGNHDIGNKLSLGPTVGKPIDGTTIETYREQFGDDYYSFDVGDCHLIVLNSQLLNAEPLPAAAAQWQWLEADLDSAKGKRFTFVFMHLPLFWAELDDPGGDNYEVVDEPARSRLLQLTQRYSVSAVFSGHTHLPISNRLGETGLWTLPSTTFARIFGDNHGARTDATLYDEWKLGYQLLRIYADHFVVTPIAGYPRAYPATALQDTALSPLQRFAPRQAREIEDGLLGLVVAPPPIARGNWDAAYAIDGLVGTSDLEEERSGWTSAGHARTTDDEWISVELSEEQVIETVELVPRLSFWRFPTSYSVEISRDGQAWAEVVRQPRPGPSTIPVTHTFPAQPARFVRLRSLHMRPPEPFRMGLSEMRVLGSDGVNYALTGRARAGSMSETRRTVDDRAWQMPAQLGAKWARTRPEDFAWSDIEVRPSSFHLSPAQERGLSIGLPDGVKLAMTLDARNERYADPSERQRAFGVFVRFLGSRYAPAISGWVVHYGGQPPSEFAGLVAEAGKQLAASGASGPLAAGPCSPTDAALLDAVVGQVDALIVPLRLSESAAELQAQISACRQLVGRVRSSPGVWADLELPDASAASAPAIARRMARAVIRCHEAGLRCYWSHLPASPGGLLDAVFDPQEYYYTFQTLATLFDASVVAQPIKVTPTTLPETALEVATFAGAGRLYVACWQTASAGDAETLPAVQANLEIQVGSTGVEKILAVDTLSAAGQYVKFDSSNGVVRVHGLHVGDHPVVLVLFAPA